MTRPLERTIVFFLFLALTIASAVIKGFIIFKTVESGDIKLYQGLIGLVNGGALFYFIKIFANLVNKMFLSKDLVSEEDLKRYFRNRLDRINHNFIHSPDQNKIFFQNLYGEVLRLTEGVLQNWVGSHQFELSIFADREHPEIVAYYETSGHDTPRSKTLRDKDPDYYRKNGYQVVELLDRPSQDIFVIPKTTDPKIKYKFLSEKQKEKIKSTLLYCVCSENPMVLVVVCDSPSVITKNDSRLVNLIHAVGMAIQCDYHFSNKILTP